MALLLCLLGYPDLANGTTNEPASELVAAADNAFGINLLQQIATNKLGANIFISPYSTSVALQMVCAGAEGTTRSQMQEVLGTSGTPQNLLNEGNQEISALINSKSTNFILTTANALWYQNGLSIKPAFLAGNQQFFGAKVAAVNFYNPASATVINSWASGATAGKITNVVSYPFNPAPSLLLANAVYFKGNWQTPFSTNLTVPSPFQLLTGQETVPMMNKTGTFLYAQTNGYQAIQLPYQGGKLAMYVFLPDTNSSVASILQTIASIGWPEVSQEGFSEQSGSLSLPRFNLDTSESLIPQLEALGMKNAFSSSPGVADFQNISTTYPLYISSVNQQAEIQVNETGSEAAAVTTIGVTASCVMAPLIPPFSMIINHPFLFFIEDQDTRTILFMGTVFDP